MTTTSTNLGLILYNSTSDQSGSFISWTNDVSGSSNSNMTIIDAFAGNISGSLTDARNQISGSITDINSDISSILSSISILTASTAALNLKFQKLYEFTGPGQIDFNNIPQEYKNLVIIGSGQGVPTRGAANSSPNLGADFNGDANNANYKAVQWAQQRDYMYSFYPPSSLYKDELGAVYLGSLKSTTSPSFPSSILSIIPNYSSTGMYKTAMGFGAHSDNYWVVSGNFGGVWKNTSAITRIRMFSLQSNSTRYNLLSGTIISIYGFG